MAVRPNYKKRYTREEYEELQAQESFARRLPGVIWDISGLPVSVAEAVATTPPWESPAESAANAIRTDLEHMANIDPLDETQVKTAISKYWLYAGAGLVALLAAGPIYHLAATMPRKGSRKRRKGFTYDERTAASLDAASGNVVHLMASLAPAVGLPVSYIGVQMMEDHGMITKGLGDATQTLITTAAAGGILSTLTKLIP